MSGILTESEKVGSLIDSFINNTEGGIELILKSLGYESIRFGIGSFIGSVRVRELYAYYNSNGTVMTKILMEFPEGNIVHLYQSEFKTNDQFQKFIDTWQVRLKTSVPIAGEKFKVPSEKKPSWISTAWSALRSRFNK